MALFARTSFTFMLIDVPAPPWIGSSMKLLSNFPAKASSAASAIACPIRLGIWPNLLWARAVAFLTMINPRISAG